MSTIELPDDIRVPLHRLWADAAYLIGRAKTGGTDLAVHTIKALCDEVERAVRAALAAPAPQPDQPYVEWTCSDGTKHKASIAWTAAQLRRLYDLWPGGAEEAGAFYERNRSPSAGAPQPSDQALDAMAGKAWDRFEAELNKPATKAERVHALVNDGPYPGMSEAFDAHMGAACWTDRDYAQDAATWAAAWKAALSQAPSVPPSNQAGDVRYQCRAREIESRFWGDWVACSPAEAAEYLRTPVVGDIEYGVRTLPSAQEMSQFLTDVVTAAGLLAHGKRDKVLADRIGAAAFKLRTENLSPSVKETPNG